MRAPVRSPCARLAAFQLLETHPQASAGSPLFPPPALWAGPCVFIAGLTLAAPGPMRTASLVLLLAFIGALTLMRVAGAVLKPAISPRRRITPDGLPVISVILAMHDEAEVMAGLGAALARLDYPRDRLDILFALEAEDRKTCAAARAPARRLGARVLVLPRLGPQTKPRALNYALQAARGELVAVYDAEDAPHSAQLRAAAEAFSADARLGAVQAPLGWYNRKDNWLTRQFALEYAAQFHVLLPLYARLGWPLPLGGTSNVFRKTALEACGGWDPFNVTEDADLGFRLARGGWKAGLIAPDTLEEAPVTVRAWTAQRSRWLKGHLVTWLVQMRDVRGLARTAGPGSITCLQLSLFANAAGALMHAPGMLLLLGGGAALLAGASGPAGLALMLTGLGAWLAAIACAASGARRAGFAPRIGDLAAMPAYWLLQGPAMIRALRELRRKPYLWAKTRHGVSSSLREAPHDAARHPLPDGVMRQPVRVRRLAQRAAG